MNDKNYCLWPLHKFLLRPGHISIMRMQNQQQRDHLIKSFLRTSYEPVELSGIINDQKKQKFGANPLNQIFSD